MFVIFGRQNAEAINDRYLILELETLTVNESKLECFCLVDMLVIPHAELPMLEHHKKLHQTLVDNLTQCNHDVCIDLIEHLHGKFGGELDSFYNHILERSNKV